MTDLDLDYTERAGFMVGRTAAIAEWRHRKEVGDFERLCSKLYQRKWARMKRQRAPEAMRAYQRGWRARNAERLRESERRRMAARRKPRFILCASCGTKVRAIRVMRFCSTKCRNHFHAVPRARARNRGLRNMALVPAILSALSVKSTTLHDICILVPGLKRGSVATTLTKLKSQGLVLTLPSGGRGSVYALTTAGRARCA